MIRLVVIILLFALNVSAADIYVDQTSADCSGDYSISGRACSGSDGDSYDTIQEAITNCSVGDAIHMRGGTYDMTSHGTSYASGYYISINPSTKNGTAWTAGDFTTLKSYAGEWAIIDGEDTISDSYPGRAGIGYGDSSTSDASDLEYWKFERFEIKNCESTDNTRAAAFGINGGPIWYRYLYIHDNTAADGGNNPGGIRMEHMNNTIIEYCWFYNNGTETTNQDKNSADIVTISDYDYQDSIAGGSTPYSSSHVATVKNIIRYNYFQGGSTGFKNKGAQLLSGRGSYLSDTYDEDGNKIHHNIFQNYGYGGIMSRTDFSQVYNNILDDGTWGIMLSYEDPSTTIHKVVCYNNTITDSVTRSGIAFDNGIRRKYAYNYEQGSTPYPIYGWDYNNLLDDCEASRDSDKSMSAGVQSGGAAMDLSNYYNTKNYFYRNPETDIISLVHTAPIDAANYFTQSEFEAQSYTASPRVAYLNAYDGGNLLYEGTTGADKYLTTGLHEIEGVITDADGGVGGNHPYLSGVTIPSYVGATNPDDNDWVDGVLTDLASTTWLRSTSTDRDVNDEPTWLEGTEVGAEVDATNTTSGTASIH